MLYPAPEDDETDEQRAEMEPDVDEVAGFLPLLQDFDSRLEEAGFIVPLEVLEEKMESREEEGSEEKDEYMTWGVPEDDVSIVWEHVKWLTNWVRRKRGLDGECQQAVTALHSTH